MDQISANRALSAAPYLVLGGGACWVVTAFVLGTSLGSTSGYVQTPLIDYRPLQALGLLLSGAGLSLLAPPATRLRLWGRIAGGAGLLYALGRLSRHLFFNDTGFEPMLPAGFLLFAAALAGMAISARRMLGYKRAAPWLLLAALSLVTFNDPLNPWSGIPFGFFLPFASFRMAALRESGLQARG